VLLPGGCLSVWWGTCVLLKSNKNAANRVRQIVRALPQCADLYVNAGGRSVLPEEVRACAHARV
jgi:hypothetical protein